MEKERKRLSKFIVRGLQPLQGEVQVGGAKNAALPILAATLLADSPSLIRNVPNLLDVVTMLSVLESIGCKVDKVGSMITEFPRICPT